jgi:hypothetical protein
MKRILALVAVVAVVAVTTVVPLQVHATCQNITNATINVGFSRHAIRGGAPESAQQGHIVFNGNGFSGGPELNYGSLGPAAPTVGFLPTGAVWNAWLSAAIVDGSISQCTNSRIDFTLRAMNGDNCASLQAGPWTVSYNVNTCNFLDQFYRGLVQISHNSLGFAPSYQFQATVISNGSTLGTVAGCTRVTTVGGASGCADSI